MGKNMFSWVKVYESIADALLCRRASRDEILDLFARITGDKSRDDIDPFTFFIAFNRGVVAMDRPILIEKVIKSFNLKLEVPHDFVGIPTANHELWQYFDQSDEGVEQCWELFAMALAFADDPSSFDRDKKRAFGSAFDTVHAQENINKANLTRALYWVRPAAYLPLGGKIRDFIHSRYGLNPPYSLNGLQYFRLVKECSIVAEDPFYVLAAKAFYNAHANSWWPPLASFDPKVDADTWQLYLLDPDVCSAEALTAMVRLVDFGGVATGEELAKRYGKDARYYVDSFKDFARKAGAKLGIAAYKGSDWPIAFLGQNANEEHRGDWLFKIRPELMNAILRIHNQ